MAINSNALSINNSIAANSSFQGRSPDSSFGPVGDALGADGDPNAGGANGSAATGDSGSAGSSGATTNSGSAGTAGGTASSQKSGPSAQTRNAQGSRAQGSGRAHSRAAGAAGSPSTAAAAQDSDDDGSANFGSVMATARGRSAAGGTDADAPSKSSTAPDDPAGTANTAQAATSPTDAVAWIAQVLMTPGAAQAATAAAATNAANAADDGRVGAAGTRTGARGGLPPALGASTDDSDEDPNAATVAAGTATAGGQAVADAAAANRLKFATDPTQPLVQDAGQATVQTTDAQAAAATAANSPGGANLNALADVQKLISGLTGTATASDTDGATTPAAPAAHSTTPTGATDAAQAAAAMQASSLTRSGAGLGTTTLSIQAPVGSAAFADEVSSRVTGLAQAGITQAQLQLNPTDLGPVQVHITMQSGQASVWFGATHSDTRAALEQSLPRLREMFAGAGVPLSDSGVFREPPQQQQAQSLPALGTSRTMASETAATASVTQVATVRLSLLDTYA